VRRAELRVEPNLAELDLAGEVALRGVARALRPEVGEGPRDGAIRLTADERAVEVGTGLVVPVEVRVARALRIEVVEQAVDCGVEGERGGQLLRLVDRAAP
jgi:hypothetical protein